MKKLFGKSKKEQIAAFHNLSEQVLAQIPDLRDPNGPGKAVHEAQATWERLQSERKRVSEELRKCSTSGPGGSIAKFDSVVDAGLLLEGAAVDSLTAPVEESRRSTLMRQLRAIEHALPGAEQRIHRAATATTIRACKDLQPAAAGIIEKTLIAAETLLNCLRDEAEFFQSCSRRGLSNRPGHWHLQPVEETLLFGAHGYSSLEVYIRERRQIWGITDENPKAKGR
jgi:hypothetical protein